MAADMATKSHKALFCTYCKMQIEAICENYSQCCVWYLNWTPKSQLLPTLTSQTLTIPYSHFKVGWGNVVLWSQNNILYGVSDELRTTSALPIFGVHKMALGCSGLHANGCFNANQNFPRPKIYAKICPALSYLLYTVYPQVRTHRNLMQPLTINNNRFHFRMRCRCSRPLLHLLHMVTITKRGLGI